MRQEAIYKGDINIRPSQIGTIKVDDECESVLQSVGTISMITVVVVISRTVKKSKILRLITLCMVWLYLSRKFPLS